REDGQGDQDEHREPEPFLVGDERDRARDGDRGHDREQQDLPQQPPRATGGQAEARRGGYRSHRIAPPPSPRTARAGTVNPRHRRSGGCGRSDPRGSPGRSARNVDYWLAIPSRIALAAAVRAVLGSVPPTIADSAMPNGLQT